MTAEQFDDLVSEMYWAVREEAALFEVPLGTIDKLPFGDVSHGPWQPDACAALLSRWLGAGLLGLYRYTPTRGNGAELSNEEAEHRLAEPSTWLPSQDWTQVEALFLTDKGAATPYEAWRTLAG